MTKRVSNSRASRHNGLMARQFSKMGWGGHQRLLAESREALAHSSAPGSMRMAARAMIEATGKKDGGAHRKAAGRGS